MSLLYVLEYKVPRDLSRIILGFLPFDMLHKYEIPLELLRKYYNQYDSIECFETCDDIRADIRSGKRSGLFPGKNKFCGYDVDDENDCECYKYDSDCKEFHDEEEYEYRSSFFVGNGFYDIKKHNFWITLCTHQEFSEEFMREFKNDMCWCAVSKHQPLKKCFMREFKDRLEWDYISQSQDLSDFFIVEFKSLIYWDQISYHQTLSEGFIRFFKDKLEWRCISLNQALSEQFILEFKDKINWGEIKRNPAISQEVKNKVSRLFT